MAIITEEPGSPKLRQRKPKTESESESDPPPASSSPPSSSSTTTTAYSANPCQVWFYFIITVSIITLIFSILTSLSAQDTKTWFLNLPPILRQHHSTGRSLKVQMAPDRPLVEVFSIQQGRSDSDSRVLIVHGFGCSSFAFRDVVKYLGRKDIYAVAIDLPGSGFSDKTITVVEKTVAGDGFFSKLWGVYEEIKQKGLFWGFDQLVEQGYVDFDDNKARIVEKQSIKPIELGSEEMGRVLGQIVDTMGLAPVDLVLHDSALGLSANWISQNPGSIRSVVILDGSSSSPALPLWGLEEAVRIRFVFERVLAFCCVTPVSRVEADAHRILLRGMDGGEAVIATGKKLNSSFSVSEWGSLDSVKGLPVQLIWSGVWSDKWTNEGREMANVFAHGAFATHSGGRWVQEHNSEEVAEIIFEFISSLPKPRRYEEPPKHHRDISGAGPQHHHVDHHLGHNGHGHGHAAYGNPHYGLEHGWGI